MSSFLRPSTSLLESRLRELKIVVPDLETPAGLYSPAIRIGSTLVTSGQLPKSDGRLVYKGKLGREIDIETGKRAARLALVNALAAIKHHLGGAWKGLKRPLALRVAIASAVGFTEQAAVADAASELLLQLFGAAEGTHARFTWGAVELPLGACLELDLTVEIHPH